MQTCAERNPPVAHTLVMWHGGIELFLHRSMAKHHIWGFRHRLGKLAVTRLLLLGELRNSSYRNCCGEFHGKYAVPYGACFVPAQSGCRAKICNISLKLLKQPTRKKMRDSRASPMPKGCMPEDVRSADRASLTLYL